MNEVRVSFSTPAGRLSGVIHYPQTSCRGCIITCHGLFSSKDSLKFLELGKVFAQHDFAVLRFDFRGCGESQGRIEDTTISGRKEDLMAALAFMMKRLPSPAQTIGLLGSSMGGYISLLVAPFHSSVKAVVAWATPYSFDGLAEVPSRNNHPSLKDTFHQDTKRHHVSSPVSRVNNLLLIHGDQDESVPQEHAEKLYQLAQEPKQLTIIAGADHTFSNPQLRKQAVTASLNWFNRYLS